MFGIELHGFFLGRRVKSAPFAASGLAESADISCVSTDDDDGDRTFNASPAPDISAILGTDPYCFDIESKNSRHTFWGSPSLASESAEFDSIAGQAAATAIADFDVGRNIILLY
jgi:hypothetical protein